MNRHHVSGLDNARANRAIIEFRIEGSRVLALGRPLDVLVAGNDARATASVSAFIESLGLRPLDVGGLEMAHWLEGAGLLMMGLAGHGAGFNIALGVDILG